MPEQEQSPSPSQAKLALSVAGVFIMSCSCSSSTFPLSHLSLLSLFTFQLLLVIFIARAHCISRKSKRDFQKCPSSFQFGIERALQHLSLTFPTELTYALIDGWMNGWTSVAGQDETKTMATGCVDCCGRSTSSFLLPASQTSSHVPDTSAGIRILFLKYLYRNSAAPLQLPLFSSLSAA